MTAPDPLPDWLDDLARALPPMVPLADAAIAVCRNPRTLQRAAKRQELVMLRGDGGRAIIPRSSLLSWVATWPRVE